MLNKLVYLVLGLVLGVMFIPYSSLRQRGNQTPLAQILGTKTELHLVEAATPEIASNLEPPVLSLRAAFAFDVATGAILYTKDFDASLPVASLTKLLTALVVLEHAALPEIVTVRTQETEIIGNKMGLVAAEQITVENLLKGLLISSSNDAALTLANYISGSEEEFVKLMNEKAQALGLANSYFADAAGLDSLSGYSTAQDLAKLVKIVIQQPFLNEVMATAQTEVASVDGRVVHPLVTTNKLMLEDESIVGIKTGYTSEAKGNLILRSIDGSRDVITIVLGSESREADSGKLLHWLFAVYRW